MEKYKRNERMAIITKILSGNPNKVFTLNYFCELLNAAKSTISEDVNVIKKTLEDVSLGIIETIPGISGGVKYRPIVNNQQSFEFLNEICIKLKDKSRIIPGSFIYMSDILYDPVYAEKFGEIFASYFMDRNAEYVATIETKGIAPAFMTAKALNIPLIIARRDHEVTEGTTISINYISGSSQRIHTMSLSKRTIKEGSRILLIDDFMKAGGTIKGLHDLIKEFNAEVVGTGVVMSTLEPEEKLIKDCYSLLTLKNVNNPQNFIDIEIGI